MKYVCRVYRSGASCVQLQGQDTSSDTPLHVACESGFSPPLHIPHRHLVSLHHTSTITNLE